jgi:glycosyltransferase involved in cell wall biosynthesis
MLFSALDVATICILDTPFGRYCFPQKAYEIMATGTPVVASAVGAIKGVLAAHGNLLYPPGDPGTLAARVHAQLLNPEVPIVDIQDWAGLIARMEMDLVEAVEKSKGEASA